MLTGCVFFSKKLLIKGKLSCDDIFENMLVTSNETSFKFNGIVGYFSVNSVEILTEYLKSNCIFTVQQYKLVISQVYPFLKENNKIH